MPTEITQEERTQYFRAAKDAIAIAVGPHGTPPPILWHYTAGESLLKIINSSTLWATQISCLNDNSEFREADRLFLNAINEYATTNQLNDDEQFFYEFALKNSANDSAPTSWWFVASFSAERDDLSQWRAYGGGEGGYSIGFDTEKLSQLALASHSYLAPVQYDPDIQHDIAKKLARDTFSFFKQGLLNRPGVTREEWLPIFGYAWSQAITWLAPITKNPKFRTEHEWRLVRQLQETDRPKMEYLQRKSMMSRHFPLPISYDENGHKLLPITEIIVGPCRHKQITKVSVCDLLLTKGYPKAVIEKVVVSDVPFQML